MGMTFEEFVMFSMLSEQEKLALAEKFAKKRMSPEHMKIASMLGGSVLSVWADSLINSAG
jgi:hypothetical protein